ncbi:hypothetical protein GHT06_010968 [Daphnia sinensis]|uniref:Fe2OG dioxygenase domain-containing protein n=1 Tax=Daphnia sinensis TaxID=1820382 RepID=A0AAD5Q1P4_9CRUS|nr:hypothetical protein GHT06_010968 [Daphnia sinensis]
MEDVIPIIDLDKLGLQTAKFEDVDQTLVDRVSKELDSAFSTVGFVYLKNHGVDQELVDNLFQRSKSFFHLPEAIKETYRCGVENCDGYTGRDGEILDTSARHEIRESYDVASPNGLYPDEHAPEFRQAINDLAPPMCELTLRLLSCMALALGLDKNFFGDKHSYMFKAAEKNRTIFRTLYYPSLADTDTLAGVVRCGLHSDYGTITLLLQDDMGGLEILSQGKWFPAKPIPGTIMINLGDMMQFWTSDRYVATVHRVVVPEEEIRRRTPRQSIAFFVHPDNDVMIAPLDGSGKHQPVDALSYVKSRLIASSYK